MKQNKRVSGLSGGKRRRRRGKDALYGFRDGVAEEASEVGRPVAAPLYGNRRMNFCDLFRGFLGFPGERRPLFGGITRDDDEDDDDDDDPMVHLGFGLGETYFHMFREFDNFFREMGTMGLPPQGTEFLRIEALPPGDQKSRTLRDLMLKYPDSHKPNTRLFEDDTGPSSPEIKGPRERQPVLADSPREDRDLDSHVTSGHLEMILPPAESSSYFKSVSITKVMSPDGTVEERRTVRDSRGHEETVVTIQGGGNPVLGLDGNLKGETESLLRRGGWSSLLDRFF